jgi:hypothetical protein
MLSFFNRIDEKLPQQDIYREEITWDGVEK